MGAFDFSAPKKKLEEIIIIERIRKMKNKKGFTLVELIVVLVILAILAALLIPALTGYIDKANKQSVIAETRQAVMAAQTIASEQYANDASFNGGNIKDDTGATVTYKAAIEKLAEVNTDTVTGVVVEKGKVKTLTYNNGKKTCTYNADATGDKYTVSSRKNII